MLTKNDVQKAAPKDKRYTMSDGDGLLLAIYPNKRKVWQVRLWRDGKETRQVIGEYPEMGLSAARKAKDIAKQAYANMTEGRLTFKQLADEWILKVAKVQAPASYSRYEVWLRYVPTLHNKPIHEITRRDLVSAVESIATEHTLSVAERFAAVLGRVFEYAMNQGYLETSPAVNMISALPERHKKKHFDAVLDDDGIGKLMASLEFVGNTTFRHVLQFIAYTFPRLGETLKATWEEIDFDNATWTIPAEHTKRDKAHIVPLSRQALSILKAQYRRTGGKSLIFANRHGRLIAKPVILQNLKSLRGLEDDYRPAKSTVHGFRATASTVLNRSGLWRVDAIERQLSHSPESRDAVRAAYNREEYMEERVSMMQWYADRLDELKAQAEANIKKAVQ